MRWLRRGNETIPWARVGTVALIGVLAVGTLVPLVKSGLRVHKDLVQVQKNPTEENKRELDASLEVSKAMVGGIGTIATIFGGAVLYLNFHTAQEKQVTERFAKAIEHLGTNNVYLQLGGISALKRIANDSPKDYWEIMDILSAYVREKSPLEVWQESVPVGNQCSSEENMESGQKIEEKKEARKKLPVYVQAALNVIGQRVKQDPEGKSIDLSYTNFAGACLRGAYLKESALIRSNLEDANLMGANLSGADFTGAILRLANLSGADFTGANLNGAILKDADLSGAILKDADLDGADLKGAILTSADLTGANFIGAYLMDADLTDVEGWNDKQLENATLCRTKLPKGCNLNPKRNCE